VNPLTAIAADTNASEDQGSDLRTVLAGWVVSAARSLEVTARLEVALVATEQ